MGVSVLRVEYFHTTIRDRPGEAYKLLARLADAKINLLAFSAVPTGPELTTLTLFPEHVEQLARVAEQESIVLHGPHVAFLVRGDDRLGALADFHRQLSDARVNLYASHGVTDGRGGYGYILYVKSEDIARAAAALGI